MSDPSLRDARLERLIVQCRQQSIQCRQQSASGQVPEVGACFELFRRALEDRDADAWAAIERQYRPMLARWLRARGIPEDEIDDHAQEALTRFWLTLSRQPDALQERFGRVGALLRYLHQCAVSTHLDRIRQSQQRRRLQDRCLQQEEGAPGMPPGALEALLKEESLRKIRVWIAENVTDPAEQLVLRGSIDEGLSPAELQRQNPSLFPDTQTVHRMKERILKRARRALLGGAPDDLG